MTFCIPEELGNGSRKACVVGEFNDWSVTAHPMKKRKDGTLHATIDLEKGRAYQFRYLLDEETWVNDPDADGCVPTPFGDCENAVLMV